jgi:hypothetical protein
MGMLSNRRRSDPEVGAHQPPASGMAALRPVDRCEGSVLGLFGIAWSDPEGSSGRGGLLGMVHIARADHVDLWD